MKKKGIPVIQFYGERGLVNGIFLDIYSNKDKAEAKLNKFFGAIKLYGERQLPWFAGVTECRWMIEPSFAQFGDPDFIATF